MRIYPIIILLAMSLTAFAQVKDVSVLAGVNVPMYKGIESDAVLAVNYGRFNHKGLGFRVGLQWSPSVADIDNSFGVPVAFSYRTGSRGFSERLQSGAAGSRDAIAYESAYGDAGGKARSMAGGFLMNLFSDMEFFIGLTPGYVAGASSGILKSAWGDSWQYREETWTEKKNAFSIPIDTGICLNYSVWRLDIKLMPGFHYNLTANYIHHKITGTEGAAMREHDTPLRWSFTFCGGLHTVSDKRTVFTYL